MPAARSDGYVHVAVNGDTFDTIAFSAYRDDRSASTIIRANPEYADVIRFEGGERVFVPYISGVETPETLAPWRR